jgi:hypothetical protein
MLNEFCKLTGYNRSYASRKLRQAKQTRPYKKVNKTPQRGKGRKKLYGPECLEPLLKIWAVLDMVCGRRMAAGINDVLDAMIRTGEFVPTSDVEAKLRRMSASTIDRILAGEKKKMCLKGRATTKPGSLLKSKIPIRTGTEWDEGMPGFVEMDTVAHCGTTTRGQYVVTLDVTDIQTCWSEQRACLNKAEKHVFAEVKEIRTRMPFKVKGMDSDSGSEFINDEMYRYCKREDIVFTRGRPYKKNDGCHVEQKNWSIVRQTIGYGRFETPEECTILNEIYDRLRLLTNFFMPSQKLIFKGRVGARIIRKLDTPLTPYRRIMASEHIDEASKKRLTVLFNTLDPVRLRREVIELVGKLYALAVELRG